MLKWEFSLYCFLRSIAPNKSAILHIPIVYLHGKIICTLENFLALIHLRFTFDENTQGSGFLIASLHTYVSSYSYACVTSLDQVRSTRLGCVIPHILYTYLITFILYTYTLHKSTWVLVYSVYVSVGMHYLYNVYKFSEKALPFRHSFAGVKYAKSPPFSS